MNQIEFNVVGKEGYPGKSVRIVIDGIDLISQLDEFERRSTEDEALLADCSALDARNLRLDGHLYLHLKAENISHRITEKAIQFVCSCGCRGGWDMLVDISRQNGKTIWSDFEQPNSGPSCFEFWDYSGFGPFEFDSEQYFGALERARQQALKL